MTRADEYLATRYRLERRIAVGGMGEVWRGTDTVLDRPVAIKLLQAGGGGDAEAAARFRDEARHVGALSHAGIAQIYDYCEASGERPPFLVMELVEGPSLAELLRTGPLAPARAMDIVAQVADALHEAHAAGIVHRDVKPGNVLLGPGDQVKIIDFGIAQTARSAEVTGTGSVIGSPAYLAPERVRGDAATAASDLYSLGIVAHECLAGAPPFSGTSVDIAHAHVYGRLPPLPADIPAELTAFVEQLTAKAPAARPSSAAEVAVRARYLRDLARVNHTMRLPVPLAGWDQYDSASTPAGPPAPATAAAAHGRGRPRTGLVRLLVIVAFVLLAGLAGWQLKSALGSGQARHAPPAGHSPAMVTVSPTALDGQDVSTVRQDLLRLGLRPQVTWQPTDQQQPGTVLSVTPSGQVRPGTVIVLTVAAKQHGQGHDHGNGNGGDGGNGNGNGGGGGD